MKLKTAIYKVVIGTNCAEYQTDNDFSVQVVATDAQSAIKKVSLKKDEYYAEVRLTARADK